MIVPKLYLGNLWSAKNRITLLNNNITHVLTVALDIEPPYPNVINIIQFKFVVTVTRNSYIM